MSDTDLQARLRKAAERKMKQLQDTIDSTPPHRLGKHDPIGLLNDILEWQAADEIARLTDTVERLRAERTAANNRSTCATAITIKTRAKADALAEAVEKARNLPHANICLPRQGRHPNECGRCAAVFEMEKRLTDYRGDGK